MCTLPPDIHFSFSSLTSYLQCPMSFKMNKIDK